jgi:hypothetical protein
LGNDLAAVVQAENGEVLAMAKVTVDLLAIGWQSDFHSDSSFRNREMGKA